MTRLTAHLLRQTPSPPPHHDLLIDHRFQVVDERFNGLDERFKGLDERFRGIDERFKGIDERFNGVEHQIEAMGNRIRGEMFRSHTALALTMVGTNAVLFGTAIAVALR